MRGKLSHVNTSCPVRPEEGVHTKEGALRCQTGEGQL